MRPTVTDYQQNFKATEKGQYESENTKLFCVLYLFYCSSRSIFCISNVVVNADKTNSVAIVVNIVHIYFKCGRLSLQLKTLQILKVKLRQYVYIRTESITSNEIQKLQNK